MGRSLFLMIVTAACAGACAGAGSGGGDKPDAGSSGNCKTACNTPDMCCEINADFFCIDVTASDRNHCGTCDNVCNPFTTDQCAGTTCQCGNQPACASDKACCAAPGGAACVDTQGDRDNCGSCGHSCGANGTCTNGMCTCGGSNCTGTQICCGATCVDPTVDGNCGGCGIDCSATGDTCQGSPPACQGGSTGGGCTAGAQDMCGGVCQDICNDAANCGGCGQACSGSDPCVFGLCFDSVNFAFYQAGASLDCTML